LFDVPGGLFGNLDRNSGKSDHGKLRDGERDRRQRNHYRKWAGLSLGDISLFTHLIVSRRDACLGRHRLGSRFLPTNLPGDDPAWPIADLGINAIQIFADHPQAEKLHRAQEE